MKKIIFLLIISSGCYSQNYSAYQKQQPLSGEIDLPESKRPVPSPSTVISESNRLKGKSDREVYQVFQDSAQEAFKQNDFKKCIYLFEKASGINMYVSDASFKYIAGVSYYQIAVQLDDKKYRKRAKELLKQADYAGYVDARIFLKENF